MTKSGENIIILSVSGVHQLENRTMEIYCETLDLEKEIKDVYNSYNCIHKTSWFQNTRYSKTIKVEGIYVEDLVNITRY